MKYLIFFLIGVFAFNNSKADDMVVFRSIPWGTHIDSIYIYGEKINFVPTNNSRNDKAFKIENDDLSIGTVRLTELQYIFNEDKRLTKIYMIGDRRFFPDMNFILRHRFGEPDDVKELVRINLREWQVGNVKFILTDMMESDIFTLTIDSRWELSERYRINTQIDDF